MKKWITLNKLQIVNSKLQIDNLIKLLLENRGIKTKKQINEFLNPRLEDVTVQSVGINKSQLQKAVSRIKDAIKEKQQIIIFGDYDVDGICGSAILWETLNSLGAKVLPYIPRRIEEGYGLSIKGIENVILNSFQDPSSNKMPKQVRHDKRGLIITVDNGIVANEAVQFAKKEGIDVIITDHHVPGKSLPKSYAIVHTTKLCGAGVAYLLSRVILNSFQDPGSNKMPKQVRHDKTEDSHLELVALATIADLVPLTGANRTFVKFGIEALKNTKRIGLLELFKEAGIDKNSIGTYEVGHIIAPRLNAMGRLESAMDSLRLLCTTNTIRAKELARKLSSINSQRQNFTQEASMHAITNYKLRITDNQRLIFIAHESYQQGIIGLVAGKLVEEYYLPSIVVSKGEKYSKASARSISGFNIIEFIRSASDLLVDAGGHPMAAGFTVETAKLELVQRKLTELAQKKISKKLLERTLRIDCELDLDSITKELYDTIQKLSPFGMGNPVPTFVGKDVQIEDMRVVGQDGKHVRLKLKVKSQNSKVIEGIGFGMSDKSAELKVGESIDIVYTIDENVWNGNKSLQLKIKNIKTSN